MTRLQKKCLIAVAGTHLMLVVLVLCSGFFKPAPKPDDTEVLTAIPANIIDAAFRSGMRNAPPPTPTPPTPVVTPPQPVQQPTPPQPKPVVQPPPPKPVDKPEEPKPVEHTESKPPEIHKIDPSLVPVVRTKTQQTDDSEAKAKAEAKAEAARQAREDREAKRLRDAQLKAIRTAASSIRENTASSTTVDMPPGQSSAAYADYASVVKTVYTENWTLPDSAASDDANVKVSVTIASDGTVTDAHIVEKSGDASVDSSVQRTLEKVTQIRPFPEGSTDKERTYIINFNLKAKRMLG